jgi:4a-hydroxytetrahydrobiopterin dehydratase
MMAIVRLSDIEIDEGLKTIDNWTLDAHAASISKTWTFQSFKAAIGFIVNVGEIAESQNHHPEFLSTYTNVQIRLLTHDAGGLTRKDFELAVAIDQLMPRDI